MVSKIKSCAINGLNAMLTEVEVGFSRGLPGITIVGLPDNAVKESKERIKFALKNSGYEFPNATKIVINLSPADVRKEGSHLDLPMAVGIIKNHYKIREDHSQHYLFYGELNLDGELNHVKGVLNLAVYAKRNGFQGIVIPKKNGNEASFVKGIKIYAFDHLQDVIQFLSQPESMSPFSNSDYSTLSHEIEIDFMEIKGQYLAKRAMEIAAAGFHNVLMIGPPGSGKSMISKALPSILPDMTEDEILETSLIYSAAGYLSGNHPLILNRPFRSPHHTISDVGISGGGKYPIPGEISLAHNGVLFLDEISYFKKSALEVLRQPLEDGQISISRSLTSLTFPAKFMLIAAMNPMEDSMISHHYALFSAQQRRHYYSKLSKPLLDRIDLHLEVKRVPIDEITSSARSESSVEIKQRVVKARNIQLERFKKTRNKKIFANGQMSNREIKKFCLLDKEGEQILKMAMEKFQFSARSYFKILKIARTIADLNEKENIDIVHVQEALQYRNLDLFQE